ncbi:MAG: hypothetical protein M9921_04385 [Fimbriimonadaceae bacterium]|nr:DUF3052 domain-containing protein [Chthonomonadaceae bacterium]MCO5296074.1 hypothetical protein [Fimbriimonadaceae bacterium]
MAGYSGTPLPKKLGIKAGSRVALHNPPPTFPADLTPLPDGVDLAETLTEGAEKFDILLLFVPSLTALEGVLDLAVAALATTGGLWIAWPKKASGIPTDLSDGLVREVGLATGLVDNKVCAIDATWSALRFVVRLKNR